MNDLQTITEIVNSAVKDSSYITVLISSGVFIAYTLIIKLVELFKSKDRNKPLLQMAAAIKDISENVVKLNQVLDKTIQDAETKEIGRISDVIISSLGNFKARIISLCIDTIIHNNVHENEENIKKTLYKAVSIEYYNLYSIFSAYEHDGVNVSTKIKEEWIDDITKECFKIICGGEDALNRIRLLNNKLTIMSDEYSVYIKNKVFNH